MTRTSRSLSLALKRQLFVPWREKDVRALLSLSHTDFPFPYRFVSGNPLEFESLISNSVTYTTFPFDFGLLSDDDREPTAFLRIMNVDDRIGSTILGLSSESISVDLSLVMADTPDTIEYSAPGMELVDIEIGEVAISGKLQVRGLTTEPCPGRRLSPNVSPVFFR